MNVELLQRQKTIALRSSNAFFLRDIHPRVLLHAFVDGRLNEDDGRYGGDDLVDGFARSHAGFPIASSEQIGESAEKGSQILVRTNRSGVADLTSSCATRLSGACNELSGN